MTADVRKQLEAALAGSHTFERELGGGGMSRVFLARETALDRLVVVKVLSPELMSGVSADRFAREIRLAASLQQANIVAVLTAGLTADGLPYYTMPFVEGQSLRSRLEGGLPFTIAEVISILRDAAKALAYAHDRGIVHRDIKPDNVLVSGGTAMVTDFGIAKALAASRTESHSATITQLGTSIGTPAYMAPEQAAADPATDHRADIYALGCMAYELLTGQMVFAGRSPQQMLVAHMTEDPKPVGELRKDAPADLAELVMRCLAKDAVTRPQSAAEVSRLLESVGSSQIRVPSALGRAYGYYTAATVVVLTATQAANVLIGLPDWVFPGAVVVMALGLPALMFTSWQRVARGSALAIGLFALIVVGFMTLRALGIGPAGSLFAAGKMSRNERLLVADFGVRGDADTSLGTVAGELLRTDFAQSRVLRVVGASTIRAALARMQKPANSRLDALLAREVAQREGIKAIVDGDIQPLGSGFIISARLIAAESGDALASYHEQAADQGHLISAIQKVSRSLRGKIGESLKSVRATPALEDVTTPSLDALRKYTRGVRASDDLDMPRAIAILNEAVAIDSTFAMAWRKLGVAYSNSGLTELRDSAAARAYRYRDRLSEAERDYITAYFFGSGPGRDRGRAAQAYELMLAKGDGDPNNLGVIYNGRREFARAESLFRKAIQRDPSQPNMYGVLFSILVNQRKLAQAESLASVRKENSIGAMQILRGGLVNLMYYRGQLDSFVLGTKPFAESRDLQTRANALIMIGAIERLRGRLAAAERLRREQRAADSTRGFPVAEHQLGFEAAFADIWYRGEGERGVQRLDAALLQIPIRSLGMNRRPYFRAAELYAMGGRPDKARAIMSMYDADRSDTTFKRFERPRYLNVLSDILLAEGKAAEAIAQLRASQVLPDGPTNVCAMCDAAELGFAFDRAGMPDSTIAFFEQFTSGVTQFQWGPDANFLALIVERLGQLYEEKGERQKAYASFARFVDLWKNADPDLQPRVADARKRMARLRNAEP
jgi:tetratricopeptide (TPR) repeat protein/tRNA A-37 threonylcarbamoyl transferase component Bud32